MQETAFLFFLRCESLTSDTKPEPWKEPVSLLSVSYLQNIFYDLNAAADHTQLLSKVLFELDKLFCGRDRVFTEPLDEHEALQLHNQSSARQRRDRGSAQRGDSAGSRREELSGFRVELRAQTSEPLTDVTHTPALSRKTASFRNDFTSCSMTEEMTVIEQ